MHFGYFFGQIVKDARKDRGWSQTDLVFHAFEADKGMTPRISEIENGRIAEPKRANVKAIAKALNISAEKIEQCREKARQPFVGTLTFEQHERNVKQRLKELEDKLRAATETDRALIERQLAVAQKRAADLEVDFARKQAELDAAHDRLSRLHNEMEADKIEAAKRALDEGDTKLADALFAEAQEHLTAQADDIAAEAAKLAYERGRIAEDDIRWHDADKHYGEAARLTPSYDNLIKAGMFADYCGDYRRGARIKEQLVELAEVEFGPEDERTTTALNNLAESYRAQGRYAEAEPLFRRALEIDERALGPEHPDVATDINNLAGLLRDTGRTEEAEPLFRRALEIGEKALGTDHPWVANPLNNLAELLLATGRTEEAEPLFRRALEIDEKTLGPEHPDVAIDVNNLALLLKATGRYDEAEPLYQRAIEILRKSLGDDHPNTQGVIANYEKFKAARDKQ